VSPLAAELMAAVTSAWDGLAARIVSPCAPIGANSDRARSLAVAREDGLPIPEPHYRAPTRAAG
jgi:hypothetical protein